MRSEIILGAQRTLISGTTYAMVSQTLDVGDIPFSLNFQVDDIRNISSTNGSYSKTITIPGTKNNNIRLGGLYDISADFSQFNPNIKTEARIVIDGITVMEGYFQLKKINKKVNVDSEGANISYEIVMFEETTNFFTDIKDKYLIGNSDSSFDLDYSSLDFTLTYANVTNAFTNTWVDTFCMFVGDKPSTTFLVDDFKPAIFYKKYLESIGEIYGYTFSGSFIDDPNFANEIIPYNGPRIINNEVILEDREFKVGIVAGTSVTETYILNGKNKIDTLPNGVVDMYDVVMNDDTTVPFFNNGNYDISTNEWTVTENGIYSLNMTFQVDGEMTATQEAFLVDSETSPVLLKQHPNIKPQRLVLKITPLINGVEIGTSHITTEVVGEGLLIGDDIIPRNEIGSGAEVLAAFRSDNSFTRTFTTSLLDDKTLLDNVELRVGDVVTIKYGLYTDFNVVYAESTLTLPTDITMELTPNATTSFMRNTGEDFSWTEGDAVVMNDFIPVKTKVSDLFSDIQKRYNLLFTVDPDNAKNLVIESRDAFYARGETLDWTDKVDFNTMSIDLLSNLQDKKVLFSYTPEENDEWNDDYTDSTTDIYGQKEIEYTNEFISSTKKVETPFSPTPMILSYKDETNQRRMMVPNISTHAPNNNIRVLFFQGNVSTLRSTFDFYDISSGNLNTLSSYPCASTFNSNINPTIDLNFGECVQYYVGTEMQSLTENNAFNRYWKDTIEQIAEGKIVNVMMNLNASDIATIKDNLNNTIFIKDTYYVINQINDYTLSESILTKVELLKIKPFNPWVEIDVVNNTTLTLKQKVSETVLNKIWYDRRGVELSTTTRRNEELVLNSNGTQGVIGSNSMGGSLETSPEASKNQILSPSAMVTGEGNLIAEYTENTIISGDRNLVESNTKNSGILGGNDNTIEAGLTGAWAIGVSDKKITRNNEIWLGDNLHIIDGVVIPVYDVIDGGQDTLLNAPYGDNKYEIVEGGEDELRTDFPENPDITIIDGNT